MRQHYIIALFITVAACDFLEPGECRHPGDLFGPCLDGGQGAPDDNCTPGLACFTAKSGHMCVPPIVTPSGEPTADIWAVNVCAAEIGDLRCLHSEGHCFAACGSGCKGGTVCDDGTDLCVFPY